MDFAKNFAAGLLILALLVIASASVTAHLSDSYQKENGKSNESFIEEMEKMHENCPMMNSANEEEMHERMKGMHASMHGMMH
jgi:hypothetical protein